MDLEDLTDSKSEEDEVMQDMDINKVTEKDYDTKIQLALVKNTLTSNANVGPTLIEIKNKMEIMYNVLKACIKEKNINTFYKTDVMVDRMTFYSGICKSLVLEILHKTRTPEETYLPEESVQESPGIDYAIRQTLIKKYIKNSKIPTADSLHSVMKDKGTKYTINQQLKIIGYIWYRLPNTKRAIIIEHPKRALERQRYLQQIAQVRKEKQPICYIESKILNKTDKHISHFKNYLTKDINYVVVFIAVDNTVGFRGGHIFLLKSYDRCQKVIENHIIENYIPMLKEPTVIILEDKIFYTKSFPVPSIESDKSDMIKWLQVNRIPHDENLHRSELFELIERCNIKGDLHTFDAVVHANGHKVLRRPSRTEYLNYYKALWDKLPAYQNVPNFISTRSLKFWKNIDRRLQRMENYTYGEDLTMEKIIDQIVTMANDIHVSNWADIECDEQEDSLTKEEFIVEVKYTPQDKKELHEHEKLYSLETESSTSACK